MRLTLTTWQLHPYFLLHPIMVLTNTLLEHILSHLEAIERLIKWAIEISEYDIEYQSHPMIKGQALMDFLVGIVRREEQELWMVFLDGLANSKGSGVGVVLISPQGEETKLAIVRLVLSIKYWSGIRSSIDWIAGCTGFDAFGLSIGGPASEGHLWD